MGLRSYTRKGACHSVLCAVDEDRLDEMGVLADYIERRLAEELDRRGTVVWYDEPEDWSGFVERLLGGSQPPDAANCDVRVAGREAKLVVFAGSYCEMLSACEPLTSGAEVPRLLIYLAGEPHIGELSPLRELECIGGEQEPFQRPLKQMARAAFHERWARGQQDRRADRADGGELRLPRCGADRW